MSKASVAVRIAGHDYKILSDGDAGSLRNIASYVDQAMDRVRKRTGTVDTLDVSVLTCLNLAREILALRGQKNEAVDEDRMRSLIERVETILGGETSSSSRAEDPAEDGVVEADSSPDHSSGEAQSRSKGRAPARTLDLPSVEALRDRASAPSGASAAEASMPEARVFAGGRERAS